MGVNNLAWANPQFAPVLPIWSDPAGGGDGWTPGINVTAGQVYLMYISNYSLSGQAFNLSWQLGSGASLDCTVLPVELLTFGAESDGNSVVIHWSTASEHNASHYEVQRSSDGQSFDQLGRVEAVGNSSVTTDYGFIDDAPAPGLSYYRLAQVDVNGSGSLSGQVTVDRNARPIEGPFPNPVTDFARWRLAKGSPAMEVIVIDALGQVVLTLSRSTSDGGLVTIPAEALPRGAYALVAQDAAGNTLARASLVKY
jgi:hypothetical protein